MLVEGQFEIVAIAKAENNLLRVTLKSESNGDVAVLYMTRQDLDPAEVGTEVSGRFTETTG